MVNVILIAKKEFSDLLTNGMVVLLLGIYTFYLGYSIYQFNTQLASGQLNNFYDPFQNGGFGVTCSAFIYSMICDISIMIGVIAGCASISNELRNYALNTLAVKPLYRDTIINGKLLGTLSFIIFVMIVTAFLFTANLIIVDGSGLSPYLGDYLSRLAAGFAVLTLFVGIFLALSMFVSIIVKNQAFSLMIGLILVFLSKDIVTTSVSGTIDLAFTGTDTLIRCLSPYGLQEFIMTDLFGPSYSTMDALSRSWPYLLGLTGFLVFAVLLSYIAFLRRDIL